MTHTAKIERPSAPAEERVCPGCGLDQQSAEAASIWKHKSNPSRDKCLACGTSLKPWEEKNAHTPAPETAAERDRLREQVSELLEALQDLFAMMDEQLIVRNTDNDDSPNFHTDAIRFTQRLAKSASRNS